MREITYREAVAEAMSEEMRRDERVFLIGEEVAEYNGAYKASKGMLEEFGSRRIIDTPIAELGFTGIAVGAAMNGLRPIVEYMTWNFAVLASDQIMNHAAKMLQMSGGQFTTPIVFRGPNGPAGQLGATHSQSYEAMYSAIPGLKVVTPFTPYEAKKMYGDKGMIPEGEFLVPIGKANVRQKGSDVTIVSFGKILKVVHAAADELAKEGVEVEIIDLVTIRPLDLATIIESVKKTNRLIIVEESFPVSSVSSEVAYRVQRNAFDHLDAPIIRLCQSDTPFAFATTLIDEALPQIKEIIEAVRNVTYIK